MPMKLLWQGRLREEANCNLSDLLKRIKTKESEVVIQLRILLFLKGIGDLDKIKLKVHLLIFVCELREEAEHNNRP